MSTTAQYTRPEELAHSLTAALGIVACAVAIPILAWVSRDDPWRLAAALAFGISALAMFVTSVVYHWARQPELKALLRKLDHGAIFLLIAGTYTPFTLGPLSGPVGWTLFGVIWTLAVVGVMLKAFDRIEHPLASLGLYLLMGWLCVVAIGPLQQRVPLPGLLLLGAGGLSYMAGVAFFTFDSRLRYGHFIWHLFVLAGTACHFFAVLGYAA